MNERIEKMARTALSGVDRNVRFEIPLGSTEELKSYDGVADGLCRYMDGYPTVIYDDDVLIGRFRMTGCPYPSDLYRRIGYTSYNKYWNGLCSSSPGPVFYWGWTHLVLDFDYILKHGLSGYTELIDGIKEQNELQRAMRKVLESVCKMSERYAEVCSSEETRAILKKVPRYPADTFREAIQSVWSTFLMSPDSLGRIDLYLYPYYVNDIASGVLDREAAKELLQELFVKVYETQMNNVALPISGHNHLVVGGYTEDGRDGYNELSELILESIAELPTFRPQASFRYTKYTTRETMKKVTELNAKCQWIVFVNDEPRIPGMVKCGIDYADAVNYTVVGCNEWCLSSGAKIDLAHVNLMHSVEELLYEDEKLPYAESFEEVMDLYRAHLKSDVDAIVDEYDRFAEAQRGVHDVLSSALSIPCITSGRSITDGGSEYNGLTMSFNSISNAADSLSVIKQFVFEEKKLTVSELLNILRNDYKGHEDFRHEILTRGRFFGNDDDRVDDIACRIVDMIYDAGSGIRNENINVSVVGSFVGATSPNIIFGRMTRATPDGRRSGDAFTMGISQSDGKDKSGLSALLNSIAKPDYGKFCGCIVSNIKLDRSYASSDEKLTKLSFLYQTFLENGGMQLQINYLSQDDLIRARQEPEKYGDLVVRVTGYSGYFTRFDPDLQDDIIRRTQASCR